MIIDSQTVKLTKEALALITLPNCDPTETHFKGVDQKHTSLIALSRVKNLFRSDHWLNCRWKLLTLRQKVCLLSLIAIGQEHLFQPNPQKIKDGEKKWRAFLDCLEHTEDFYADIGGVIGYHAKVIALLHSPQTSNQRCYLPPPKVDPSKGSRKIDQTVEIALRKWDSTALIIPAGGAGDRLNLLAEDGMPLPAAFLTIGGKTLLEAIIRDLTGCEYAAFKLTGKRVLTPIAIMTSGEKNNHLLISKYLEEQNYFGRPKDRFYLFCQPNVPMISSGGMWISASPLQLFTKPGGHGVLWRLAQHLGIFDWLDRLGCQKAIIRQINNPLAGTDKGLLNLAGWGWSSGKSMGFTSCARAPDMAEGVNAVVQRSGARGFTYSLENIEYNELPADLAKNCDLTEPYLANVNLLFIDLKTIQALSTRAPLPGLTVNFKTPLGSQFGEKAALAGRLESTMQNISSYLGYESIDQLTEIDAEKLPTYAIFCERNKILSAAKRARSSSSLVETPETAYLDLNRSHFALLKQCGFSMPLGDRDGLAAMIALHPALGPDWQIVVQKIRGGSIGQNSYLELDIAEIDMEALELSGALQIISSPPHLMQGRCSLRNVTVKNRGVAKLLSSEYWSCPPQPSESLTIILHGISEFCAENVVFSGPKTLHVPAGYKMVAHQKGTDVVYRQIPLSEDETWHWHYGFANGQWQLKKLKKPISIAMSVEK